VQLIHGYAAAWLALALIDAGDHAAAAEILDDQLVVLNGTGQFAANSLLSARGHLRLAQGRPDEAIDDLVRCGQGLVAWSVQNPWLCPWLPQHALALHARGNSAAARETATTALDAALSWGAPYVIVEALRVAAITERRGPRQDVAFRRAVESAEAHGSPLDRARTQHALGSTMRRAGRRGDARAPLRLALDLAMQCGATGMAQLAHDELVACGAQPRRLRSTGVHALTPTERRIADLAAPGMTNREIAQALFVAEKTVETHLSAVYRKLDISSRSQLERVLGDGSQTQVQQQAR
jgi:DNA-binding CsgD family transcriptional regulator